MPLPSDQLQRIIAERFPDSDIRIEDLAGDNDHYRLHIASAAFAGKNRVQMHQMVFAAIRGTPAESIHALSLVTSQPK